MNIIHCSQGVTKSYPRLYTQLVTRPKKCIH